MNSVWTQAQSPEAKPQTSAWLYFAIGCGLLAFVTVFDAYRIFDRQWSILYFLVALYVWWSLRGRLELCLYGAITVSAFLVPVIFRPEMRLYNRTSGALAGWIAIVAMRDRRHFFAALQQANNDLEGKVTVRTSELQAINESLRREIIKRKEAEEWFTKIFHASPVGICTTIAEDGKVVDVNEAFLKCLGRRRAEVVDHSTLELGYWTDESERKQMLQTLGKDGAITNSEFAIRRIDGEIRQVLRSFESLTINGRCYVLTLCNDITERKQIDDELRASRQRLEALSRQLIMTQETERSNLARELHDEFGQVLAAMKMNIRRIQTTDDENLQSSLEENISMIDRCVSQVRDIALNLRPPQLDELGLSAALNWYLKKQARIADIQVALVVEPPEIQVPRELATVCYRIAQESVTNALSHAAARRIEIELKRFDAVLHLIIHDDGRGFDVPHALACATEGASFGLSSMLERVALSNGHIEIDSTSQRGTTIHAWFQLSPVSIV